MPSFAKSALLAVDVQEDFCPPNGALAVPCGRDIVATVNELLSLPFALKIATKDHHPRGHISFASSHPGAEPFTSFTTIVNPHNPNEKYETRLWPDHCVIGTPGNELIPELDQSKVHRIILKGTDPRVEMYSAFRSPLRDPPLKEAISELEDLLSGEGIETVLVVGLAGDYCVKFTAIDSAECGWTTYVVDEGTRCVHGDGSWEDTKHVLSEKNIQVVNLDWVQQVSVEEF
ncbi:isochorismatase family hydrolase [Panus rudis PR-1116 ss-1]|nr:isochorismatase family hydrolase [Panus rudis PR-1116 ss-1]